MFRLPLVFINCSSKEYALLVLYSVLTNVPLTSLMFSYFSRPIRLEAPRKNDKRKAKSLDLKK